MENRNLVRKIFLALALVVISSAPYANGETRSGKNYSAYTDPAESQAEAESRATEEEAANRNKAFVEAGIGGFLVSVIPTVLFSDIEGPADATAIITRAIIIGGVTYFVTTHDNKITKVVNHGAQEAVNKIKATGTKTIKKVSNKSTELKQAMVKELEQTRGNGRGTFSISDLYNKK